MNKPNTQVASSDAQRLGPLRLVHDPDGDGALFHIYTRPNETPGNLNNFAVAECYNEDDARFLIKAANCHTDLLKACMLILKRGYALDASDHALIVDAVSKAEAI